MESANEIQNLNYENGIGNGTQNQTGLFLKGRDNNNTKFRLHLCSLYVCVCVCFFFAVNLHLCALQ